METIIAGTDFTSSSLNACKYAAMLAGRLKCRLVLFNLLDTPVIHTNIGMLGVSYANKRRQSSEKMNKLLVELSGAFPELLINQFITNGDFKLELKEFIKKHKVRAAVMGLESKNKLSKYIYGSHGTSIAGKISAPVIIVPEKYKKHNLKNIMLAVDNEEKLRKTQLKDLELISERSKSDVHFVHVRTPKEIFTPKNNIIVFHKKQVPLQLIKAKNPANGVSNYCKKNPVDLLAIISRKHSVFYNFFMETNTKKLIFASRVPVMSIHE